MSEKSKNLIVKNNALNSYPFYKLSHTTILGKLRLNII